MDRERLGRVLGKGARLAARTAMEAVDAATAAAPPEAPGRQPAASQRPVGTVNTPTILTPSRLKPAASAARAGVMTPLRRASRELWHELTGSFFALFAFGFAVAVWHTRANAWSHVVGDRYRFALMCLVTLLFGYFAVSSFARARRKQAG